MSQGARSSPSFRHGRCGVICRPDQHCRQADPLHRRGRDPCRGCTPGQAPGEKAGIPTMMTLMGLGAVPADHPRALGMLGMHAARYTNMALGLRSLDRCWRAPMTAPRARSQRSAPRRASSISILMPVSWTRSRRHMWASWAMCGRCWRHCCQWSRTQPRTAWLTHIEELKALYLTDARGRRPVHALWPGAPDRQPARR